MKENKYENKKIKNVTALDYTAKFIKMYSN